ncbi:hypothetical protein ACJX0J_039064 [Zea mays]
MASRIQHYLTVPREENNGVDESNRKRMHGVERKDRDPRKAQAHYLSIRSFFTKGMTVKTRKLTDMSHVVATGFVRVIHSMTKTNLYYNMFAIHLYMKHELYCR